MGRRSRFLDPPRSGPCAEPTARAGPGTRSFLALRDLLLGETEFFIRKAIGWVAREVGRRDPGEVSVWMRRNLERMNRVTLREAVKYLPDGDEIVCAGSRDDGVNHGTKKLRDGGSLDIEL